MIGRSPDDLLAGYLDRWVGMTESEWQEATVKALFDEINGIFRENADAETSYRAWSQANPQARLI